MPNSNRAYHLVLPAAGMGSRLGGDLPKQFRLLGTKPMLAYAIEAALNTPEIHSIWVGLSPQFHEAESILYLEGMAERAQGRLHLLPTGGATRHETVLNTLSALLNVQISPDDWVLVHDAARPGITVGLIQQLIAAVNAAETNQPNLWGGLLAMPLADTLKRAELSTRGSLAQATLARQHLWQAQTPQMFQLGTLHSALTQALEVGVEITDEASAMELLGAKPLLVEGATRNFKVTHPADWDLMHTVLLHLP
ncbi:2-C-methyl-D-erythritol 4-phosphate cytidylyltransferase [Polynucleobacter sp. IMCC30063]|uniref:2-C-methyl-D-erythritol 4-phosphate cytidylyltransferase n=1 Tax=unclassified Polynucleobacter TaxID=2640945 RepID=UPI001F3F7CF1|nr:MULTISPECIES: 2-C-methyl-D-erythritol 4-phosphate cytidylyltransferase [unclassified Polynucleobacter]MCE7506904.1 2-C-methyl-D-erythritol 4-phosphate cytidylyltransferase [Polynucleobacter sp. IMCC30063]MCE7528714.1 2-C-methyl-D-erythritol 4-phosphate cytidylyltransferase [Polynucleobacter sp. IMCC 29146]